MALHDVEERVSGPVPPRGEPDLAALIERAKVDAERYAKAEMAFLKAEAEARAELLKPAAGMFGAAGVLAWFALFALTMAFGFALALLIGVPLAFLAVAVIYLVAALLLAKAGQARAKKASEMQADRVRRRREGRSVL